MSPWGTKFWSGMSESVWAERHLIPQGYFVLRTRPICPYPQVAVYKGTGDTNGAANFACTAP